MALSRTIVVIGLLTLTAMCGYFWTRSPAYWLDARIKEYEAREVWRFQRKGEPAYFIRSGGADGYNPVLSASGDYVCSPSGGMEGDGDEECPLTALADPGTEITRIWPETVAPGERLVVPPLNAVQTQRHDVVAQ